MNTLSKEELNRYSRHLILKDFGPAAQQKLKAASVLIVGAGGLGCPVIQYLAASGIGTIGIVDEDDVQVSNLPRQILYSLQDIGKKKALTSAAWIHKYNLHVVVRSFPIKINSANAIEIIKPFDLVVDCSDNFPTRYLLNDACILLNKPLVYGSVLEYEGHVAVFNKADGKNVSANYRDIFPTPPPPEAVPSCEQAGVLGVLPGIIGMMQANEVIKLVTGIGEVLINKLLILDSLTMDISVITIRTQISNQRIEKLIDYDEYCGFAKSKDHGTKEITVQELQQMFQLNEDFQLIDVREPFEFQICNLSGELIPASEVPFRMNEIQKNKKVVLYCKNGQRSGQTVLWLEQHAGFTNLYNLRGGIIAWIREIDSTLPEY